MNRFHYYLSACILVLLNAPVSLLAQELKESTASHREELNLDAANPFRLFDDRFYANQLFLLGESHGVQKPQEVDLALLKHLNQRIGVRYYIAEVDYTKAYFLNQYLQTGADSTLMKVFRSWINERAQWGNRDFFRKIQKIRALNQTLPAERRIRFVGIDAIHDKPLVAEHIAALIQEKSLPEGGKALADAVMSRLHRQKDTTAAEAALHWLAGVQKGEAAYRNALGAATDDLMHLLTTIGYPKTIKYREAIIVANFKTLFRKLGLEREKLYGFWGFWHVLQGPTNRPVLPMAAQLRRSDLPIHDRIVSITFSYVACYTMVPTQYLPPFWQEKNKAFTRLDKFNNDGPMMITEGIEEMKAQSKPNSLTLFGLDYPGSPFRETPITVQYEPYMPESQKLAFDAKLPTTDYFQYIILVRNSDMTEPFTP